MNKISHLLTTLLLVLCFASAALAEIRPGSFTLSGILGGYTFDGRQHLETRPVIGLRGGYNFTKYLGFEALFDYVPTEGTTDAGDTNVFRYGGEMLLHLLPDNRLVPYLAAGYGGITLDRDNGGSTTRGIFSAGPGVEYFLKDNVSLRGDFRVLLSDDQKTNADYEYTAGITYHFGGVRPAAAPVAAPAAPANVTPVPPPPPAETEKQAPGGEVGEGGPGGKIEEEAPLEEPPAAEPAPGKYKYCVTLHLEFDINRAEIRPEFHDEVAKVGTFMKENPSTSAVFEGHTDEVGSDEYNMELSKKRAEAVAAYLQREFGIDPGRMTTKGYGKTKPIADNSTDAGKQKNRRIEAAIDCVFDVKEHKPPERLCVSLQLEFDTNSAKIKPEFKDEIAKVGDYMKKYPSTTALIEGHTDNTGTPEVNRRLSQQRAESVVNYLVENFGIDRARLTAKGYGSSRRIAYNSTPEGRHANRRINAVIDCVAAP
ncbi:OmpA family protein [Geobacter sp. SVR]|uniref:OmpA family protein n=1 Tax=Geobacter sp. SVR TaxID=2495594 RepID=UPI00143EF842|nr:OmpA family protein [Geobacter sp. SVR]BCS54850.1 membrane protein [Geobacter sp. SVR]GCF86342.1 membrane protein [Geobacter sp. SVR]